MTNEVIDDEDVEVSPVLKGLIAVTVLCVFMPFVVSILCWQRRERKEAEEHKQVTESKSGNRHRSADIEID